MRKIAKNDLRWFFYARIITLLVARNNQGLHY